METETSDFTIMFADSPTPAHVKFKKVEIPTAPEVRTEVKSSGGDRPKRFLSRQISQSKLTGPGMFKSSQTKSSAQNPW